MQGKSDYRRPDDKYRHSYAMAKLVITISNFMPCFEMVNEEKSYDQMIRPFNFYIVGIGNFADPATKETVKPLAPFGRYVQRCAYENFIDYST